MWPAAEAGDFARFSRSVYRFGYQAGLCFAGRQGGAFASQRIAELVEAARNLGVEGVGQSSWGPTVFALLANEEAARRFAEAIAARLQADDTCTVVRPAAVGLKSHGK